MGTTANIGIRIVLEDSASAGFNALGGTMRGFGGLLASLAGTWQNLSPRMQAAGLIAAGSGIAFAGFASILGQAIQANAELETSLARVAIAMDGAAQHMGPLRDLIIKLADDSKFTTSQVADAFVALGQHGIDAADVLNTDVGEATIHLAEAIMTDTVPAATLLSSTLQMFNLSAKDATMVADGLAYSFDHGTPSVAQMQEALNQVAPLATTLGVHFQQLMPIIDALNQRWNSGTQTGTALKYILQSIIDPTSKAAGEFAALGIITVQKANPALKEFTAELYASGNAGAIAAQAFINSGGTVYALQQMYSAAKKVGLINIDETFIQWAVDAGYIKDAFFNAKGEFIGFEQALDLLNVKIKGMSTEKAAQALDEAFSRTGARGAMELLKNWGVSKGIIDQLNEGIKQHGTALTKANEVMDTYASRLQELQTTWTSFLAQIGGVISPVLKGFYMLLNGIISAFISLGPWVSGAAAIFLVLGTGISGVTFVVSALIFLFGTMGSILLPVLGVVAAIVGVVLLLSAVIALVNAHAKELGVFFAPLVHLFQQIGGFLHDTVIVPFQELAGVIGGMISSEFGQLGQYLQQTLVPAWNKLVESVKPLMPVVKAVAMFVGAIIGTTLVSIIAVAGGIIAAVVMYISRMILGLIQVITGVVTAVVGAIRIIVGIVQLFIGIFQLLTGNNKAGLATIQAAWQNLAGGVMGIIHGFILAITGAFNFVINSIVGFVQGFVQSIISFFKHLADVLVGHSIVPDMLNGILNVFTNVGGKIVNFVTGLVKGIVDGFKKAGEGIANFGKCIADMVKNATGWFGKLGHAITNIPVVGPAIKGVGSFLHLPGFADGGIVSSATVAMVGEGREAEIITPMSKLIAAAQQAAYAGGNRGGGAQTINLVVDGKVLTQVFMDRLTGQLRMNGMGRAGR